MRRVAGCAVVVVAMLAAAAPAGAAATPSQLAVFTLGDGGEIDASYVIGIVTSPNRRCVSGRRIEVSLTTPTGRVPLDIALSGKNGGWYARGPKGLLSGATTVNVKLEKRKVGAGAGAIRCGGAKENLT